MDKPPEQDLETGSDSTDPSWRQRHGAAIIAAVVIAMLVLLIALNF